jgi:hypothetical protein
MDYIRVDGKQVALNFVFLVNPPFWPEDVPVETEDYNRTCPKHASLLITGEQLRNVLAWPDVTEMWLARGADFVYIHVKGAQYAMGAQNYLEFLKRFYPKNEDKLHWQEVGF